MLFYNVFYNIFNAVKACHNIGIFHLDLKLENIMLKKDGSIVLVDFGLAQCVHVSEGVSPICHNVLGTRGYMPQKIISNKINSVGCSSVDVYSLGCILYVMEFKTYYDPSSRLDRIKQSSLRKLISGMICEIEENRLTMEQVAQSLWFRPVYLYILPLSTNWRTLERVHKKISISISDRSESESKYNDTLPKILMETLRDYVADETSDITFPTLLILDKEITMNGDKYLYGVTFDRLENMPPGAALMAFRKHAKKRRQKMSNKQKYKNSPFSKNRQSVNRSRRKHK